MQKITQKFLLSNGFSYSYYSGKTYTKKSIGEFTILWNAMFKYSYVEFDFELDGEIEKEVLAFKTIGCWIFISDNQLYKLKYQEEINNLNLNINISNKEKEFLYIIKSNLGYKIGRTNNIDNRNAIFNVKLPFNWYFVDIFPVDNSKKLERLFHSIFKLKKINGEWYDLLESDVMDIKRFLQTPYSP